MKKAKRGQKASWNEDQITRRIDIIVNDDEVVKKLIFTNAKKASNNEVFKNVFFSISGRILFKIKSNVSLETLNAFLNLPFIICR